jgi:hypothetical protein
MAKRTTGTSTIPPANEHEPDPSAANGAATPRKPRTVRKCPYRLEEIVLGAVLEKSDGELNETLPPVTRRVKDSPDFDDTAAAIRWGEEQHLACEFRVVQVKASGTFATEERKVTKAVVA